MKIRPDDKKKRRKYNPTNKPSNQLLTHKSFVIQVAENEISVFSVAAAVVGFP